MRYISLASKTPHWIGGQYLSRAHRGDPGAEAPIVPAPLSMQQRAFSILNDYLFSDKHLTFLPQVLERLGYSEWAGYGYVGWENYGNLPVWAYNPPQRHDYPIVDNIGHAQAAAIDYLFQPAVLARLEQNPLESTGPTLTLPQFFSWMQQSVYRELGERASISLLRRNLQSIYEDKLIALATAPAAAAPPDAQAFARLELGRIAQAANARVAGGGLDDATRAHLETLAQKAQNALKPK
jgi:hypothetical protein